MYYSDKYSSIPYGIVNKRSCGVGASSFALENKDSVVLVVPNVAMIQNKTAQYPNKRRSEAVFGLYSGIDLRDLAAYLKKATTPKIMVTYDSFYKLKEFIDEEYHIIIDEFSELLDAYGYRDKAINSLLDQVFHYPKLSFISATPIVKEYLPSILAELPYTELEWEDSTPVKVIPVNTTKPLTAVLNTIQKYKLGLVELKGFKSEAAYFFINSVRLIRQIVDDAELLPSQVRIICANNKENENKLDLFKIQTTLDPEKLINFVTSNSFKGSDIYSETGIAYVVSNNTHLNTLLTIDTDIYQIAGRIRNETNPFRNTIFHIFNENPLKLGEEEFNKYIERKSNDTLEMINIFNTTETNQREIFLRNIKVDGDDNYLHLDFNKDLIFDEIKLLQEKRVYECVIKVYQSGLNILNTYKADSKYQIEDDSEFINVEFLTKTNSIQMCKLLVEGKCKPEDIEVRYPLIAEGYRKLGGDKLKALGYSSTKIRNEINNLNNKDDIELAIKKLFTPGFYPNKDVKVMLARLYKDLEINKTAKASDIGEMFNIKPITKRFGKTTVTGFEIL